MKKINVNHLIFYLIVLFSATTVLQGLPWLGNINKIMMFALLGLLIVNVFFRKINRKEIFIIAITVTLYVFAFLFTENKIDINIIFYFMLWVIYFLYIERNYETIINFAENKTKFIRNVLIFWNIVVGISMFFPSSYKNHLFSPFACGEHRFGSCCLMITVLNYILVIKTRKRSYFRYSIVPIIGIYMCGARTYLAVYIVLFMCLFYLNCKRKSTFYMMLIPVAVMLVLLIKISPVGNKMEETYTEGYYGVLATVTSGRSQFWTYDLKEFFELNIGKQFVGNGFDFVYNVNYKYIKKKIWAHNDFINIIMNFGYIGLFVYNYVLFSYSKKIINKNNLKRIQRYSFYFIWFFNAFFNMVYTYTVATLAIPFIMYAICNDYHKIKKLE